MKLTSYEDGIPSRNLRIPTTPLNSNIPRLRMRGASHKQNDGRDDTRDNHRCGEEIQNPHLTPLRRADHSRDKHCNSETRQSETDDAERIADQVPFEGEDEVLGFADEVEEMAAEAVGDAFEGDAEICPLEDLGEGNVSLERLVARIMGEGKERTREVRMRASSKPAFLVR